MNVFKYIAFIDLDEILMPIAPARTWSDIIAAARSSSDSKTTDGRLFSRGSLCVGKHASCQKALAAWSLGILTVITASQVEDKVQLNCTAVGFYVASIARHGFLSAYSK